MATPTILIICPECGKQIKAPESVFGKKIRCKFCQAAFVAKPSSGKASSAKPAGKPTKPPAEKPAPVKPANDDDDDEDPNPYGMVDVSLAARCPDCANELESEDAVICLTCGYNLRTRMKAKTRKVYDLTLGEHLVWLLPGIACAVAVLTIIGFNIWYLMKIDDLISEEDSWYLYMFRVGGIKLWVVITSLFLIWLAGKFAVKRLILHPKPPEVEKLK
jgi:ribosomal protein S27E